MLGRGGFGTVYRATFIGGGGFTKRVALKVLNSNQQDFSEHGRRLRDEARMMGLLRHRAIVRADQLVQIDGRWAVVMEYVEGVDLKRLLDAGQVPINVALEIIAEVAGALHAGLETRGNDGNKLALVHRDLKPSNVMITRWGEIKVMDFGGAKADFAGREGETRNFMFGSFNYMAPERWDFRDCPGSDVYALGCILYELVTGQAFGRTSANPQRHEPQLEDALRAFAAHLEHSSPELVQLLGSCLALEADDRPSAAELEEACFNLGRSLPGPRLRYWAEGAMSRLDSTEIEERDEALTGTLLRAEVITGSTPVQQPAPPRADDPQTRAVPAPTPQPPTAPPQAPPSTHPEDSKEATPSPTRGGSPVKLILGAVLTGILGLTIGTVSLMLVVDHLQPEPPKTSPTATQTNVQRSATMDADQPASLPAHQPDKTETKRSPERTSAQASPPAATTPASPTKSGTQVSLSGDAVRVHLLPTGGGAKVPLPGRAAPGSYEIYAAFDDSDPFKAGQLVVSEDSSPTIHCSGSMYRCTGR